MSERKNTIAIVGAGKGGCAILSMFLGFPNIDVKYLYDARPDSPGILLAKEHGITCLHDLSFAELAGNAEINLILEITGQRDVFHQLNGLKSPDTSLIGSDGSRFLFDLLGIEKQINQTLEEKIHERTLELEEQVRQHSLLNEQLQRVNNQKTKYLLQSTHQLKAPFAAIQSYTDLILDGYTGEIPGKTREIVEKVKTRCEFLSTSIKSMLKLANLKSFVTRNITMTPLNLNAVTADVVDEFLPLASHRGVAVNVHPCANEPSVMGNLPQVTILLSNLIENAICYSRGGEVRVDCAVEDGAAVFSVTDHGIGIDSDHVEKIFQEFFRSNEAVEAHRNGTGLGLAIAKEIADIHGYRMHVSSSKENGTTFTLVAPLAAS